MLHSHPESIGGRLLLLSQAAASLAARLHGKLCKISFKTHLLGVPWDPRADGARQVRLACRKAGSRGRMTPDPVSRSCVVSWNHYHKTTTAGTFHNVHRMDGDDPELPEHEVQNPEDGKPCLIQSRHDLVKTRSVQDTICSIHISRCLFLSHTPSQLLRRSSTWRPLLLSSMPHQPL